MGSSRLRLYVSKLILLTKFNIFALFLAFETIEGVLKAAGQNIKRCLNYNNWWNLKHPVGGVLLPLVSSYSIRCYMPLYRWVLACNCVT
jgi:hypothetical protein